MQYSRLRGHFVRDTEIKNRYTMCLKISVTRMYAANVGSESVSQMQGAQRANLLDLDLKYLGYLNSRQLGG